MNRTFTPKGFLKPSIVRSLSLSVTMLVAIVSGLNAQCSTHCSISCHPYVNVVVSEGTCEAFVTPSMVSNAISVACESEYSVELRDENNLIIPNARLTKAHVGKDISFHLSNTVLGCENFCWGRIVVENKNAPVPRTSFVDGMCGAAELEFIDLEDIAEYLIDDCTVPVSNLIEVIENFGNKCDGQMTVRTVYGNVNIDGSRKVVVRIDTTLLTPMDTGMIVCPGSPDFNEALEIDCHDAGDYPTPDILAGLFHDTLAYPWINKGKLETSRDTFVVIDSVAFDTTTQKIELPNGSWALFPVITKDTAYMDSIVTDSTTQYLVILPGQKDCNITAKYEDWKYDGCVGPESKINRIWTILDWCTGELKMCKQWIVVTDKTAPWITVPDYLVKIDAVPWTCMGEVDLSNYIEVKGGCTEPFVQLRASDGLLIGTHLSEIGVADSPITITVQANNNCGVEAIKTFQIKVADRSAPVAIAKDELKVTLTGDPYLTEVGVAKISVDAIDGGSHDSGCGEVETCILLDEELQDPFIINGLHLTDAAGNLLYHQHQCGDADGYYPIYSGGKNPVLIDEIPYVICKDYVKFCCKDIPMQRVALVVSDESPHSPDGYSWSDVEIEDKSVPIIVCNDIEVECGYSVHPDDIGYPTIYDPICSDGEVIWIDDEDVDACGSGEIIRLWFYGDQALCTQRITFYIKEVFDPTLIKWPMHHDGQVFNGVRRECEVLKDSEGEIIYKNEYDEYGNVISQTPIKGIIEYPEAIAMSSPFECGVTEDTGLPTWCNETCGLVASSFEDFPSEASDACKKIIRRWTIIDWCRWQPNGNNTDDENDTYSEQFEAVNDEWLTDPDCYECHKESGMQDDVYLRYRDGFYEEDGYYTYDQVIKIVDYTAPAIDAPVLDTVLIITGAEYKDDTFEECVNSGTVMASALDVCGTDILIADDRLTWSIVTRNEAGIVIAGPKQVIGIEAEMTTGVGMAGTFHEIEWTVTDACGNTSRETTTVEFADGKNPTPVCKQDLSTSTMNTDGTVEIWATDFDHGSYDNCGSLKFLFLVDDNGDLTTDVDNGTFVPAVTFECEDVTAGQGGTINIDMYVIDDYGNYDFCMVRLRIDDNADACPDGNSGAALIAGAIYTPSDDMIEEAQVSLDSDKFMMTKSDGIYGFNNSSLGGTYVIQPEKDGDDLNGISIIDIYALEHYILGIREFTSPFEFIAADINSDQKVSGLDLIELRKTFLGATDGFIQNTSWRFVDAEQEFKNESSPWPLKESITIEKLQSNTRNQNFIGIKTGDLNGNAIANSTKSKGRSDKTLFLHIEDRQVDAGENFNIRITSSEQINLAAFQMIFEHQGAELLSVHSALVEINEDDYNRLSNNSSIISGYNMLDLIALDNGSEVMTIEFKAIQDLTINETIKMTESHLPSMAYDANRNELSLELNFINSASEFSLEQNHPNPFTDQTEIAFVLPKAGQATITMFDVTGRVLLTIQDQFAKGRNSIQISTEQLEGTNSVIYYQLESGDYTATLKMIKLQ